MDRSGINRCTDGSRSVGMEGISHFVLAPVFYHIKIGSGPLEILAFGPAQLLYLAPTL